MYIDPFYYDVAFALLFSFVGFKIGVAYQLSKHDEIVEGTIDYLISSGFVNSKINSDGDIELIPLKQDDKK
jgi:hypothetical protein